MALKSVCVHPKYDFPSVWLGELGVLAVKKLYIPDFATISPQCMRPSVPPCFDFLNPKGVSDASASNAHSGLTEFPANFTHA
jgi:hypothetical protein